MLLAYVIHKPTRICQVLISFVQCHPVLTCLTVASLFFLFTMLKEISCAILVDILCRLMDKFRLKPSPSDIIPMNFISISGTDSTYLTTGTSPSKYSSFSNNLILIELAVLKKTRLCSSLNHVHTT